MKFYPIKYTQILCVLLRSVITVPRQWLSLAERAPHEEIPPFYRDPVGIAIMLIDADSGAMSGRALLLAADTEERVAAACTIYFDAVEIQDGMSADTAAQFDTTAGVFPKFRERGEFHVVGKKSRSVCPMVLGSGA